MNTLRQKIVGQDSVFYYTDFKDYLQKRFSKSDARGSRLKLAEKIRSKPSYISKVFSGAIRLSLEHVPVINEFLEHSEQESEYFMQLVLYTQAGSNELKNCFKKKLDQIIEEGRIKASHIPNQMEISQEALSQFVSKWHYNVVHTLLGVHEFQTKIALAKKLNLPLATITNTLQFLIQNGLAENNGNQFKKTNRRIHISKNSPWVAQYHTNSRFLAIKNFPTAKKTDLHFSGIYYVTQDEITWILMKFKELQLELEQKFSKCTEESEQVRALSFDFFEI